MESPDERRHDMNTFLPTRRRITKTTAARLRKIAREHGADFVGPVCLPGCWLTGWFEGPNRGFPFDRHMETAVAEAVARAGITL